MQAILGRVDTSTGLLVFMLLVRDTWEAYGSTEAMQTAANGRGRLREATSEPWLRERGQSGVKVLRGRPNAWHGSVSRAWVCLNLMGHAVILAGRTPPPPGRTPPSHRHRHVLLLRCLQYNRDSHASICLAHRVHMCMRRSKQPAARMHACTAARIQAVSGSFIPPALTRTNH